MDTTPTTDDNDNRVAVIHCAVLEVEVDALLRSSDGVVHVEKLEQGLHNEPDRLRSELQQAVQRVEAESDANVIVLVYGLCSRGIEGVTTGRCRLVIPRAHDCITLLLGSKEGYAEYVAEHPGTYWYSPGWNKHHTPPGKERYEKLRREYADRYGEDNADYLMTCEQHWFETYHRATYVHLSVGATDSDKSYTRDCADWLGWTYDEQQGDPGLLGALLGGAWDADRFLVLEPGQTIRVTGDDQIIAAADAHGGTRDEQ